MKTPKTNGFTLVELVVVLVLVAIFVVIAFPTGSTVQVKGRQTMALSDVKQIVLACKIYASDGI
jgi:prepilin-type N-terminal cleavage/methylation domain-containing protein